MKAKQDTGCSPRVSDDEADQLLLIDGAVTHSAGFGRRLIQSWWLKEDPLLGPPEKEQEAEQQPEDQEHADHRSTKRGFQWVCMAGNLRQCEFR